MPDSQIYLGNIPLSSTANLIDALKEYDTSWVSVKTFSNTTPDSVNSAPAEEDFVPVNLENGIKALEVYAKDLVLTNAPTSIVVGIWVKIGTDTPYLLGSFGATVGENRATVLDGDGFTSLSPILMEILQANETIKVACRVVVDASRIQYTVDDRAKTATQSILLGANTGFNDTLCLTDSASAGSPPGIGGVIKSYDPQSDAITVENVNIIPEEPLRLPWGNLPNIYTPPYGLSGKIVCGDIDTVNNTIRIIGSTFDFRLLCYRAVRLRLSSFLTAISGIMSGDGNALSTSTTYRLLNVTGEPGNQVAQLSSNGVSPITISAQGVGWLYIFPYSDIQNVKINTSNQLVIDNNVVDIKNDWENQPVVLTTVGTAANIAHPAHGFAANTPVILGGTTAPVGSTWGMVFYVIPVDANNYKLSAMPGGLPVAFSSAGTAVTVRAVGSNTVSAVTVTAGTPSVISFGASATTLIPHWMGVGQGFTLGGVTRPGAAYNYTNLYIATTPLTATTFSCQQMPGLPSVAFETAGTSVTLTSMIQYGFFPIDKANVRAGGGVGDSDASMVVKDINGDLIDVKGFSIFSTTLQPVNPPIITSGSIQVRPIGGI